MILNRILEVAVQLGSRFLVSKETATTRQSIGLTFVRHVDGEGVAEVGEVRIIGVSHAVAIGEGGKRGRGVRTKPAAESRRRRP